MGSVSKLTYMLYENGIYLNKDWWSNGDFVDESAVDIQIHF